MIIGRDKRIEVKPVKAYVEDNKMMVDMGDLGVLSLDIARLCHIITLPRNDSRVREMEEEGYKPIIENDKVVILQKCISFTTFTTGGRK